MKIRKHYGIIMAGIMVAGTLMAAAGSVKSRAAETTQVITEEEAKSVALGDAGLSEGDVTFRHIEKDTTHGIAVYEIEFLTATNEYDYEIAAEDGEIVGYSNELLAPSAQGSAVTADQAKSIAFTDAGLKEEEITCMRVEADKDDGIEVYEVEFTTDARKYDYEIVAAGGTISKQSWEIKGSSGAGSGSGNGHGHGWDDDDDDRDDDHDDDWDNDHDDDWDDDKA